MFVYIYVYISIERFYCRPGAPATIGCFALDTDHLKPHMDPYPFDDVRGHFECALWHDFAPIRIRSFQLLQESQWGRPGTQSFSLMALHSEGCVLIRQAAHAPVTSALGELSHRLQTLRYAQTLIWPWHFSWYRHKLCIIKRESPAMLVRRRLTVQHCVYIESNSKLSLLTLPALVCPSGFPFGGRHSPFVLRYVSSFHLSAPWLFSAGLGAFWVWLFTQKKMFSRD